MKGAEEMTKADLAAKVAGLGMTQKQAAAAVDAVISTISDALAGGGKCQTGRLRHILGEGKKGQSRAQSKDRSGTADSCQEGSRILGR